jgi:arylsulfatase A
LKSLPTLLVRIAACLAGWSAHAASNVDRSDRPPNFIILLCDNLGYGDVGPFGSKLHRTPHLDRMAQEGMKLTHCYSASGVCTPSRAALMTGSYPRRVNLHKNARGGSVLQPVEPVGLHPSEMTIAEVLKERGYATMIIGKWHLGDQLPFLPTRQGFDSAAGRAFWCLEALPSADSPPGSAGPRQRRQGARPAL